MNRVHKQQRGFTLIELMIVVAIVAILGAVAMPLYQKYVQQTYRTEAQSALLELSHFMERHYTNKGGYLTAGHTGSAPTLPYAKVPQTGTTRYELSFQQTPTAQSYTLQAVPKGMMQSDLCGTLTLSQTGKKGSAAAGQNCWK